METKVAGRKALVKWLAIAAAASAMVFGFFTVLGLVEHQRSSLESLMQVSGRIASILAGGQLEAQKSEELKVALVIAVTPLVELSPEQVVKTSVSDQSLVELCSLIRNTEKVFPKAVENAVDAQVFPALRERLQRLRPLVEKEIGSREGLSRQGMAGCHWDTAPARP